MHILGGIGEIEASSVIGYEADVAVGRVGVREICQLQQI
jgi:hypothetical protein